jgi:hypothetical protein
LSCPDRPVLAPQLSGFVPHMRTKALSSWAS